MTGGAKIKHLLGIAVKKKASDLHLSVGNAPILRIEGELRAMEGEPKLTSSALSSLVLSILDPVKKEAFKQNLGIDFAYDIPRLGRFRVNVFFERRNMALAARIIPDKIPAMEDIMMPAVMYEQLAAKQGLILVTGPSGCGKSTSLAAMINHINDERSEHIITLEDPIEFIFENKKSIIVQRELGQDMLSFADGLKHIVRQDPNVIMLGEMRDPETISAALTLAETGHLILATLHTQSASQTVERIIDVMPPFQQDQIRIQLSMSLRAVLSQRLLAREGGGRIAAREILLNNDAVANLIRENKIAQIKSVLQTSARSGMTSIDQDLKRLVKEGLVSKESALLHMSNPEMLEKIGSVKRKR